MTKGALMLPAHNNQQKLLTQILQTSSSSSSSSSGTCWACRSCFEKQGPQGTAAAAVKHKSAVQCSLTAAEPQVVQASSSSSSHATSSVVARPAQAPAEHSAQAVHEAACFPALWRSEWPGSGRRCRQLAAAVAQPSTPNPAPPPASPPIRRAACCTRPAPRHQQQHTRVD
ncbi:hypothetical protein OEZ85_000270 [Tetradesmus obliquus]|uniref:Uncharacterized protein n=1 Tax=Tetradesmus obliquus TaxID=3088 RepID=A0ABY8UT82_TETOB|nr:hypothetical protein OEZ85_000270 [Tetradesmus obliquus]